MKWVLRLLFGFIVLNIIVGYAIRQQHTALGEKWIGFSVLTATFVYMPLFLAYRWKGKRLQDYTLSDDNLKKMREPLSNPKKRT